MTAITNLLTPQVFDVLVIANLIVGILLGGYRFYRDMTRPLPSATPATDATQPHRPAT
jgi:hypothetical protein